MTGQTFRLRPKALGLSMAEIGCFHPDCPSLLQLLVSMILQQQVCMYPETDLL